VDGDDGAQEQGDVDRLGALLPALFQLLIVHRRVGAAEVEGPGGHLLDAAAGADPLVVDLHPVGLFVLLGPLGHHRDHERRAAPVQPLPGAAADQDEGAACEANAGRQTHGDLLWMSCAIRCKLGADTLLVIYESGPAPDKWSGVKIARTSLT